MFRRKLFHAVALLALVGLALGLTQLGAQGGTKARTIYMSAVEYKGGANVADEPYPPADEPGTLPLEPLGEGYELKPPDATGRWEVESYRFEPGVVAVNEGERITLEIVGINGSRHEGNLVSPSGKTTPFVVTRGRLTRVKFKANEVGVWQLVCDLHPPGMVSSIVVAG